MPNKLRKNVKKYIIILFKKIVLDDFKWCKKRNDK